MKRNMSDYSAWNHRLQVLAMKPTRLFRAEQIEQLEG